MKIFLSLIFVGVMLWLTPAASAAKFSFDELSPGQDVLDFYGGVFFSPGWIVSPPDVYEEPGGKSAEISGVTTLNAPLGLFGPNTSFYYSGGPLTVTFYEEENGLGSIVGVLDLPGEGDFFPASAEVLVLYRSAVFDSESGNRIDAFTIGGAPVVPEPSTMALSLLGIAGLILARLRMR